MVKVLSFGEILFDIIEGENYLGGAPLNFAAHLALMGAESYILSKVGNDALGNKALKEIHNIGVKTSFIQQDMQHPTGTVPVTFNNGQPNYVIRKKVAYDFIDLTSSEQALDEIDFDVLYFGTLGQRNQESGDALQQLLLKKSFKHILYDINLRKDCYTVEIIQRSLQHCTIFKLNDDEVAVVGNLLYQRKLSLQEFARKVAMDYHIPMVVVTAGAKGCYIYEKQQLNFVKGYPATVVDTVGAGDSFSAAFVYQYIQKGDPIKAADVANKLGAFVASSRGPIPVYSDAIKNDLGKS